MDANKDLDETNDALHNLRMAEGKLREDQEPTLSNYYKPSEEMKTYMEVVRGSGYLVTKLFI